MLTLSELTLKSKGCVRFVELKTIFQKQPMSLPLSSSQPNSFLSLSRQPSITIQPRPISQETNAEVDIPSSEFILPPRDDAAEYDDSGDTHNIQDDSKYVSYLIFY